MGKINTKGGEKYCDVRTVRRICRSSFSAFVAFPVDRYRSIPRSVPLLG